MTHEVLRGVPEALHGLLTALEGGIPRELPGRGIVGLWIHPPG